MLALLTKTISLLTAVAVLLPPLASSDCCCRKAHAEQRACCRDQQPAAPVAQKAGQPACPHCRKRTAEVSSVPPLTLAKRDCCCASGVPERLLTENTPRPQLEPQANSAPPVTLTTACDLSVAGQRVLVVTSPERGQRPLFTLHCVCVV